MTSKAEISPNHTGIIFAAVYRAAKLFIAPHPLFNTAGRLRAGSWFVG